MVIEGLDWRTWEESQALDIALLHDVIRSISSSISTLRPDELKKETLQKTSYLHATYTKDQIFNALARRSDLLIKRARFRSFQSRLACLKNVFDVNGSKTPERLIQRHRRDRLTWNQVLTIFQEDHGAHAFEEHKKKFQQRFKWCVDIDGPQAYVREEQQRQRRKAKHEAYLVRKQTIRAAQVLGKQWMSQALMNIVHKKMVEQREEAQHIEEMEKQQQQQLRRNNKVQKKKTPVRSTRLSKASPKGLKNHPSSRSQNFNESVSAELFQAYLDLLMPRSTSNHHPPDLKTSMELIRNEKPHATEEEIFIALVESHGDIPRSMDMLNHTVVYLNLRQNSLAYDKSYKRRGVSKETQWLQCLQLWKSKHRLHAMQALKKTPDLRLPHVMYSTKI